MTDTPRATPGTRSRWAGTVLVAPLAAALFAGATGWTLAHPPVPAADPAPAPADPVGTAAGTDPVLADLAAAVAANQARLAELMRRLDALPGTATPGTGTPATTRPGTAGHAPAPAAARAAPHPAATTAPAAPPRTAAPVPPARPPVHASTGASHAKKP